MEQLIGRTQERAELMRCYNSSRSEFVILYGRRRIGKTFLVNQVFDGQFDFYFTGSHKALKERQLELFAKALRKYGGLAFVPVVDSWYHAFDMLEELLDKKPRNERKLLFFDEMPWIDTYNSEFVVALEDFWNTWAALRDDICFVACGSATSWMVDKLIENQGGLHNRITSKIYLPPFNLNECEQYLRSHQCQWDRYTITQCYMHLGGVPYYLSLLNYERELAWNIDMLFFNTHARLSGEFDELFGVLFRDADKYTAIVRMLAERPEGLTRQEIADHVGNGGTLTKRLENLERCDFITSYTPHGRKKKGSVYRLTDFYCLFYLQFVEDVKPQAREYWILKTQTPAVYAWQGHIFELVCLKHSPLIVQRLGIAGVLTDVYPWRSSKDVHPATQIDLVIERSDRYIYLCEMKFSEAQYVITKEYADRLRIRMEVFREETKTRKALLTTFVTTYGVKTNLHSGIVQREVLMDDLYAPLMNIGR